MDELAGDMVGTLRSKKSDMLQLPLRRGSASATRFLCRFHHVGLQPAFGPDDLVRHAGISGSRIEAIHLDVIVQNFGCYCLCETHQGGLRRRVSREVRRWEAVRAAG